MEPRKGSSPGANSGAFSQTFSSRMAAAIRRTVQGSGRRGGGGSGTDFPAALVAEADDQEAEDDEDGEDGQGASDLVFERGDEGDVDVLVAGRGVDGDHAHGVFTDGEGAAGGPGVPGGIEAFLDDDGLAGIDAGVETHGVGTFAGEGGGRLGTLLDDIDVGTKVLDVVVVARRLYGIESGGIDDAGTGGVAAGDAVEDVALLVVIEDGENAGEFLGELEVFKD